MVHLIKHIVGDKVFDIWGPKRRHIIIEREAWIFWVLCFTFISIPNGGCGNASSINCKRIGRDIILGPAHNIIYLFQQRLYKFGANNLIQNRSDYVKLEPFCDRRISNIIQVMV